MIDIHCHILPGLDDGAQTVEQALTMARMAAQDGITDIIATPHTRDDMYVNDAADVAQAVRELQQEIDQAGVQVRIHPGAEVHVHVELIDHLLQEKIALLNHGSPNASERYLLLELPVMSIPAVTENILYELRVEKITPIIAHPERNAVLRDNPGILQEWIEQGAIAQLTAGSLLGQMGERARATAERFVKHHFVHVIASDAHETAKRRPQLKDAYLRLQELLPEQEAALFAANAQAILRGAAVEALEPIAVGKRKKRFWILG